MAKCKQIKTYKIKRGNKNEKEIKKFYGKPLDFSEYKNSKDKEAIDKVTDEIMSKIVELTK